MAWNLGLRYVSKERKYKSHVIKLKSVETIKKNRRGRIYILGIIERKKLNKQKRTKMYCKEYLRTVLKSKINGFYTIKTINTWAVAMMGCREGISWKRNGLK